jgi:hypothetical protein
MTILPLRQDELCGNNSWGAQSGKGPQPKRTAARTLVVRFPFTHLRNRVVGRIREMAGVSVPCQTDIDPAGIG